MRSYSKCFSEGEWVFCINITIIQSVMWMWTFPEKLFKVFFLRRSYVLCLRRVVAGAAQAEWDSDKGELRF